MLFAYLFFTLLTQGSRLLHESDSSEDFGIKALFELAENLQPEKAVGAAGEEESEIWDEDVENTFFLNEEPVGMDYVEYAVGEFEDDSEEFAVGDFDFEMNDELLNLLSDLENPTLDQRRKLLLHFDQSALQEDEGHADYGDYHEDQDHADSHEDQGGFHVDQAGFDKSLHNLEHIGDQAEHDFHADFGSGEHLDNLSKSHDILGLQKNVLDTDDMHHDLDSAHHAEDLQHDHDVHEMGQVDLHTHAVQDDRQHFADVAHQEDDAMHHTLDQMHNQQAGLQNSLNHDVHQTDVLQTEKAHVEAQNHGLPDATLAKLQKYNQVKAKVQANLKKLAQKQAAENAQNGVLAGPVQAMDASAQKHQAMVQNLRNRIEALKGQKNQNWNQHVDQGQSYTDLYKQYDATKRAKKHKMAMKTKLAEEIAKHIVEKLIQLKESGHAGRVEAICQKYPFVNDYMTDGPSSGLESAQQGPLITAVRMRLHKMEPNGPSIPGAPLPGPPGSSGSYGADGGSDSDSNEGGNQGGSDSDTNEGGNQGGDQDDQSNQEPDNMPQHMVNNLRESIKRAIGPAAAAREIPGSPGPDGSGEIVPGMYIHPGLGPLKITHPETVTCEAATCDCGFTSIRWAYKENCYNVEGDCAKCRDPQTKKLAALGFSYKYNAVVKKTLPLFTYRETDRTWHNEPKFKSTCPKGKVLTGIGTIVTKYDDKLKHSMRIKCAVGDTDEKSAY